MRYAKSWTQALKEVQEQVGVRKVDFVDGVTPDLQEAKPEFEVKYASSKKGPIKVSKFMSLEDAKKFLAQIKKEGMNGMISKGGKPVKEELDDEDEPVVKKVVKMLKKASQAHAGQADDLEKSMKESMALQMKMAADDIETYAKKHGGIDKKDMMKAAAMLKKGDKAGAMKFIKTLDTDPRDYLMKAMGEEVEIDEADKKTKDRVKMFKKLRDKKASQGFQPTGLKNEHHEKDANGEPIPHDDEEDTNEAYTMHKGMKVKNAPRSAGKDAKKDNEARRAAQRKKLGLEQVEVDEKASDYEDQIKAFLAKGGKVQKGDKPNKKKIDKVSKEFMKKLGVMKSKEAELDAKAKAELEKMMGEELEEHCGECGAEGLQEADYELYHKTFSGAMQHAYAQAKKQGFTVDPKEIDDKVATGPKKPSKGKTNRYILGTDKKKKLHVQVANLDNKRFELNMYIEETEKEHMDINETIKQVVEGYHKKKKMEDASNDKSDDGEGMDKVDPKAVKKKFKDRKDKDIDNDGDTDGSDEYLHKKRKAISKSMEKEETDSPLYSHVKRLLRNK